MLNESEIDVILEKIEKSKHPVRVVTLSLKEVPYNVLDLYILRAIEKGYMKAASAINKSIVLNRIHNANRFIEFVNNGSYIEYLGSLSFSEKCSLVEDIVFKGEFEGRESLMAFYIEIVKKEIIRENDEAVLRVNA